MIGTAAALLTTSLAGSMPGASPAVQMAYAAATVGLLVYVIGFAASFWLPEPGKDGMLE
jgi:Na+/glutamate symporter